MGEYSKWEDRPRHPVTGIPADYYFERYEPSIGGYVREPRWRNPFHKGPKLSEVWYSVTEVIEATGVHRNTVERWIRRGELKAAKAGKMWFIRGDDFLAFMNGQSAVVARLPTAG
jgi:excisionase family DNA binding protein